jgi:polar amino acid transport system substrate-binding protein
VPVEFVGYGTIASLIAGLEAGAWDIAFLAVDPGRAAEIRFTAPYLEIDGTYLVPAGLPLRAIAAATARR